MELRRFGADAQSRPAQAALTRRNLAPAAAFPLRLARRRADGTGERIMDSLLKGGVLWLLGVPILGILLLKLMGWI